MKKNKDIIVIGKRMSGYEQFQINYEQESERIFSELNKLTESELLEIIGSRLEMTLILKWPESIATFLATHIPKPGKECAWCSVSRVSSE